MVEYIQCLQKVPGSASEYISREGLQSLESCCRSVETILSQMDHKIDLVQSTFRELCIKGVGKRSSF